MATFCGIDIIEIERLKKSIQELEGFRGRVFTDSEISYCEKRNRAKFESYAARFAGKEAVLKAFGSGLADGIEWKSIEILNNEKGKPYVVLKNKALEHFHALGGKSMDISLSHCGLYAIAYAVIDT